MEETSYNKFKESVVFIPLVSAYFIIYGAINLITFYNQFNINILGCIEFSEIIVYFIKDIYLIIIIILCGVFTYVLAIRFFWVSDTYTKSENIVESNSEQRSSLNKLNEPQISTKESLEANTQTQKIKYRNDRNTRIALLILLIVFVCWLVYNTGSYYIYPIIAVLAIGLVIRYVFKVKKTIHHLSAYYLGVTLMIASFTAQLQADSIKFNYSHNGVELAIEDFAPFKSDSVNYYIGKTNKFTFIFKDSSTMVIPDESIKWIKFPKNQ